MPIGHEDRAIFAYPLDRVNEIFKAGAGAPGERPQAVWASVETGGGRRIESGRILPEPGAPDAGRDGLTARPQRRSPAAACLQLLAASKRAAFHDHP